MLRIRKCVERDVPGVMEFIHGHWAQDHVLSRSRPLMDWQHADAADPGTYTWLLAMEVEREGEGEKEAIEGVLGYIPVSRFATDLPGRPFTWLALWKIRADSKHRGAGLQLLNTLVNGTEGIIGVLGINPQHPPMYKALGYQVGELDHFFLCNPDAPQTLIQAPAGYAFPGPKGGTRVLREMDRSRLERLELEADSSIVPAKSPAYFANRYLNHPVYAYQVLLVEHAGRPEALIAVRIAEHATARVMRIVDFMGNEKSLAGCGHAIGNLLRQTGCEYADFWQYGLDPENLEACGFRKVPSGKVGGGRGPSSEGGEGSEVVVPNYFEPFMAKNARLEFAVKGLKDERLAIFRGDGDQDRPNRLPVADPAGGMS